MNTRTYNNPEDLLFLILINYQKVNKSYKGNRFETIEGFLIVYSKLISLNYSQNMYTMCA